MSLTVSEIAGLQTSKYFNTAGIAILIFDYTITLEDEVRWVWGRKWDATRFIFTVSRYMPFVGMGMTAYTALRSNLEPCPPSIVESVTHTLGIIAAEVLLVLRTCAFWQGDRRVVYGLLAYGGVTIAAIVTINVERKQLIPEGGTPSGCLLITPRNTTFLYLFLLVFEMVILFLTAYKHFHFYREVRMSVVQTIYRDDMLYIICIISITFANVILDGIFPWQFSSLLNLPQVALHSVLASRIMFNLRKSTHRLQQGGTTDSTVLSDIAYCPTPPSPQSQSTGSVTSDGLGPELSCATSEICVNLNVELARSSPRRNSRVSLV